MIADYLPIDYYFLWKQSNQVHYQQWSCQLNLISVTYTHDIIVLLNYNFISTCMATCDILCVKCQSFLWKILFPQDKTWHFHKTRLGISTTRDMEFAQDMAFPRHETWYFHDTRCGSRRTTQDVAVHA